MADITNMDNMGDVMYMVLLCSVTSHKICFNYISMILYDALLVLIVNIY